MLFSSARSPLSIGDFVFNPFSKIIISTTLILLVTSCSERSETEKAEGSVSVQIPVQTSAKSYQLQTVDLLGIKDLKQVSGDYAQFYFSPGLSGSHLVGSSPVAHFIQSGSTFIPADFISTQMASIYYHMQNMAELDRQVGAASINHWPRSVGLETQILEKEGGRKNNNAFYDGQTDAMMFVPFTNTELPIAVNAGILAHEHFHSLFFKIVVKKAVAAKKIAFNIAAEPAEPLLIQQKKTQTSADALTDKAMASLYNEVFIRGINEGLADFWGWIYTEDADFMKWSLPAYSDARTLALGNSAPGEYLTQKNIEGLITNPIPQTDHPQAENFNYYRIGTPHARFLKQWVKLYAEQQTITTKEAKIGVAQKVVTYLYELQKKVSALSEGQKINADHFFTYFAEMEKVNAKLTQESCEFLVDYLNYGNNAESNVQKCVIHDKHIVIEKSSQQIKDLLK